MEGDFLASVGHEVRDAVLAAREMLGGAADPAAEEARPGGDAPGAPRPLGYGMYVSVGGTRHQLPWQRPFPLEGLALGQLGPHDPELHIDPTRDFRFRFILPRGAGTEAERGTDGMTGTDSAGAKEARVAPGVQLVWPVQDAQEGAAEWTSVARALALLGEDPTGALQALDGARLAQGHLQKAYASLPPSMRPGLRALVRFSTVAEDAALSGFVLECLPELLVTPEVLDVTPAEIAAGVATSAYCAATSPKELRARLRSLRLDDAVGRPGFGRSVEESIAEAYFGRQRGRRGAQDAT